MAGGLKVREGAPPGWPVHAKAQGARPANGLGREQTAWGAGLRSQLVAMTYAIAVVDISRSRPRRRGG